MDDAVVVRNSFWATNSSEYFPLMVVQKQHSVVIIAPFLELPTRFPEVALFRKVVSFDSFDLVLVPELGRCFELCPVVFSDPSQLAWLLTTTMVFPSGAVFHSKVCVSSLVLDASSSVDCALPVLHPAARGTIKKTKSNFGMSKKVNIVLVSLITPQVPWPLQQLHFKQPSRGTWRMQQLQASVRQTSRRLH